MIADPPAHVTNPYAIRTANNFIYANLRDSMGTDLSVVNAARVSFATQHMIFEKSDEGLIKYLAKHKHWSPFGHATMQFHIKAPVFVARQLVKHQVGLTWNEVSRRYVDNEVEFYIPDVWRGKAENKKQGSSEEEIDVNPHGRVIDEYQTVLRSAKWTYEYLMGLGVCPEQARMVLPQSMMTEWFWTGTLYAFARVCNLRLKEDAQLETRLVAQDINTQAKECFPISWKYLVKDNNE